MHFFRLDHNIVEKSDGARLQVGPSNKVKPVKLNIKNLAHNHSIEGYSLANKHIKKIGNLG